MAENDFKVILETAVIIRKFLSDIVNTRITLVVNSGIPNKLVKFLDDDEIAKHFHVSSNKVANSNNLEAIPVGYLNELRFEVVWALTNIASGSSAHTDYVVSLNCLGNIKKILENSESSTKLLEQCVWALGNISGDSIKSRDLVLNEDFFPILIRLLDEKKQLSFVRNTTWCLSNMLRGKPCVAIEYVQIILPTLINLINHTDEEVITDACWAISYAMDRSMIIYDCAVIHFFITSRATEIMIRLISNDIPLYQLPALRTIGNVIASATDENTDRVLEAGVLELISKLLSSDKISIRKECVWMLSNIAAGNANQIRKLIDAGLIQKVVEIIADYNLPFVIKKEAYWTIRNMCDWPNEEDISKYLFDCDIVRLFKIGLNGETSSICLGGLETLLKNSKERTIEEMNKYGLVDFIRNMIPGLNTKDTEVAQSILSDFDLPED